MQNLMEAFTQNMEDFGSISSPLLTQFPPEISESSGELIDAPQTPLVALNDGINENTFNTNYDDIMKQLGEGHYTNNYLNTGTAEALYEFTRSPESFHSVDPHYISPTTNMSFSTMTELTVVPVEIQNPTINELGEPSISHNQYPIDVPGSIRRPRKSNTYAISTEQPEFPQDIKPFPAPMTSNNNIRRPTTRKRQASATSGPPTPVFCSNDYENEDVKPMLISAERAASSRPKKIKKYQLNDHDDPSVKNAIAAKKNRDRKREEHERVVGLNVTLTKERDESRQEVLRLTTENSSLRQELAETRAERDNLRSLQSGTHLIADHLTAVLPGMLRGVTVPNISIGLAPGVASNRELQQQIHLQNPGPLITTFYSPGTGNLYIDAQNAHTSN